MLDILGDSNDIASSTPQQSNKSTVDSILDLFGPDSSNTSRPVTTAQSNATPPKGLVAYDKNNLTIHFALNRNAAGLVAIAVRFKNTSLSEGISGLGLQAAVPKSQKLQLMAISSTELSPQDEATQSMRVQGSQNVSFTFLRLIFYANDHTSHLCD